MIKIVLARFILACLALTLPSTLLAVTGGTIFVAAEGSDNVAVIDASTNTWITNISTGTGSIPHNPVVSPDNQYVYVTLRGTNQIAKISTVTNTLVATFSSYGAEPVHMDVSTDGSSLFVVNQKDDEVVKINTTSGALEATHSFAAPGDNTTLNLIKPHDVNVGPDGNLWVTDELQNTLSLVDASLTGLVTTITVGDRPIQVAFSGSQAFTTNYNDNTVSVIDAGTYTVTDTFNMGGGGIMGPMGAVASPDGSKLWLSGTAGDTVHAHDLLGSPIGLSYTETNGLLGAHGLDISDDGKFLYTSVRYDNYSIGRDAIAVIDSSDGSVVTTFYTPGATDLHGVAYVSAVPLPASIWLFVSGFFGLLGMARSKKNLTT